MRKTLLLVVALCLLAGACGSSASPVVTVRAAGTKTGSFPTAHMTSIVKSDAGPFAKGVTYTGGFDFVAHRGQLQFDTSSLGVPALTGNVDAIFDFSSGAAIYEHFPQFASEFGGKPWLKIDFGALATKTTGVDFNSLLQGQSSDPGSSLRLLAGATEVTKVGTEVVRGTPTTHYHAIIDVNKSADLASPQYRDALRKAADLYIVKTLPLDVWLDNRDRVRRTIRVVDPANMKFPIPAASAAAAQVGKVTVTTELYDFGARVDATVPPADQVADLSDLQGGVGRVPDGSTPTSTLPKGPSRPVSAAKAAFVAKGNAICQTMNDKTAAGGRVGPAPRVRGPG